MVENTHTHTQIGVGVFHAWLFHDRADGWVSEVFVSTDGRRACRRGAIGSTMGAYPRDTGSNPVEGNGHFFPHTVSSIFRLSLTHTHTHTPGWRGCLSLKSASCLSRFAEEDGIIEAHTCTHTHTCVGLVNCFSFLNLQGWQWLTDETGLLLLLYFLCAVLATTYFKYCRYRLLGLLFFWHFLFIVTHTISLSLSLSLSLSPPPPCLPLSLTHTCA